MTLRRLRSGFAPIDEAYEHLRGYPFRILASFVPEVPDYAYVVWVEGQEVVAWPEEVFEDGL